MYKAYRCNGAILTLHSSGVGCVWGYKELGAKLQKMGIPVMHYETSHPGEGADFDEKQLLDQLDNFMETQGLRRLED